MSDLRAKAPAQPDLPPARPRRRFDLLLWSMVGVGALVIGANAALIWFSTRTAPGLISADYYQEGLGYERIVALRQASARTGWRIETAPAAEPYLLRVRVTDRQDRPVTGLAGEALAYRPADAALDQRSALTEERDRPGYYGGALARTAPGLWHVTVTLRRGDDVVYATLDHVLP